MNWSHFVNFCNVFISCLDSHSDGTHSLQRGDGMQTFPKKTNSCILDGLTVTKFEQLIFFLHELFLQIPHGQFSFRILFMQNAPNLMEIIQVPGLRDYCSLFRVRADCLISKYKEILNTSSSLNTKKKKVFSEYKVDPSRTEHVVTTWRFQLPSRGESNLVWQNSATLKPDKRADVWKAVTLWESLQEPVHLWVEKSRRAEICRT